MNIVEKIKKNVSNLAGWNTSEKLVVFESDDWGSIRMPSRDAYSRLSAKGLPVDVGDSKRYNSFDGLANSDDFKCLFDVLQKHKDKNGRHPVFTAMSLVANPDFNKIEENKFQEYFYETLPATLDRYNLASSWDYWKQGIESGLFIPQFHGREHLNVPVWMRALREKDPFTLAGFNEGFWGFRNKKYSPINYQAAFDLDKPEDIEYQKSVLNDGLKLFEKLHGYKANFFVPPNGPFNNSLCKEAFENGIEFISTAKSQNEPLGNNMYKKQYHKLGDKIQDGQYYLTRNCSFEPSMEGINWVKSCLEEMEIAFRWRKPAIISTHRVNFIGVHDQMNREKGVAQLNLMLAKMLQKWPDIQSLTSSELGKLIKMK